MRTNNAAKLIETQIIFLAIDVSDLTDCCCNTENELFVVPVCISIYLTRIKLYEYVLSDQFPHKFGYWVLCVIPSQQPLAGVPRK